MKRETDALLDGGRGGDLPPENPELLASASGDQGVLCSPGELELEHHALLDRQGQRSHDAELATEARALVARARAIGATLEDPRGRQHCQSILDYWAIFVYRVEQDEIDADLFPFDPSLAPALVDEQFPYRFEEEMGNQAQQMLGWRRLLDECERDLAGDHLLTVMGEVGAGARFLVNNILLPNLRSGRARLKEFSGSDQWRYYEVPLGEEPAADLLRVIARQQGHDSQWITGRAEEFRHDPTTLTRILTLESELPAVLIFDRFSSLLKASAGERAAFVDNLAILLNDPRQRFYAVATLRRGQTIALSKFGPLEKPLRDGHVLMAFTTGELRHLIEEPARRVGLIFEPGLIDQLLIDIQGESTALPLLRFTLARLWKHRERNRITWRAYEQTGAGRTALRVASDNVYETLSEEQQSTLRQILLAMVNLEPDGNFTACEILRDDLYRICGNPADVDEVLDRLQRQDLIRQISSNAQVSLAISYNALLTSWPPLVAWLDELRVRNRFGLRLKQAATLWNSRGKSKDLLWQGALLVEAQREFEADPSLTTPERDFLRAGQRRKDAKLLMLAGAIVLIATAAILTIDQLNRAKRHARMSAMVRNMIGEGDAAATLLWMDERDSRWRLFPLSEVDQKRSQLARLQLPDLRFRRASPSDESGDRYHYDDLAISSDGQYVGIIRREPSVGNDQSRSDLTMEVSSSLGEEHDIVRLPVAKQIPSKVVGAAAFVRTSANDEYLLATAGQLRVWRRANGQWQRMQTSFQRLRSTASPDSIVALAASENGFILSIEQTGSDRQLRLWKLQTDRSNDAITLEEMDAFPELVNKSAQLACLSKQGHLLVVCGNDIDSATELLAWRKVSEEDRWEQALPPPWVTDLVRENRQRLHNWGWTLKGKHWKRVNSFIRAIQFSPSGKQFASACDDGQVLTWSLIDSNRERGSDASLPVPMLAPKLETELGLESSVFALTFLNEDVMITGGRDRTARFWDIHTAAEVVPPIYHGGTVTKLAFARDDTLHTTTRRMYRSWTSANFGWIESPFRAEQVVSSGDGSRILAARKPLDERKSKQRFPGSVAVREIADPNVSMAVLSHDGSVAFTASRLERSLAGKRSPEQSQPIVAALRSWATIDESLELLTLDAIPRAAFSACGEWLAVVGKRPGESLKLFLCNTGSLDGDAVGALKEEWSLGPTPGELGATASNLSINQLSFGKWKDQNVLAMVGQADDGSGSTRGIVIFGVYENADPKRMQPRFLMLRDSATGPEQEAPLGRMLPAEFPHQERAICVSFSQDGSLLAVGDAHDWVKVWDVNTLLDAVQDTNESVLRAEPVYRRRHSSDVVDLCFAPAMRGDTPLLATVTSEGEASGWTVNFHDEETPPAFKLRHEARIRSISFSHEGRWIITGGNDKAARIWHIDGELVGMLRDVGRVLHVQFLQDDGILTISQSSLISKEDDVESIYQKQARYWQIPALDQIDRRKLRQVAARQIHEGIRLDSLLDNEF